MPLLSCRNVSFPAIASNDPILALVWTFTYTLQLQLNCLMAVMEIAAVAESNADVRRADFKRTALAAKANCFIRKRVIQHW
ncbi:hypothetical protein ACSQ67_018803 [Phaseolus vulgaris]